MVLQCSRLYVMGYLHMSLFLDMWWYHCAAEDTSKHAVEFTSKQDVYIGDCHLGKLTMWTSVRTRTH